MRKAPVAMAVAFDPKKFTTFEWLTIGGALAGFIFMFLRSFGAHAGPYSGGVSGWHWGWLVLSELIALAAAALLATRELSPQTVAPLASLPVSIRLMVAGATVLAALITLIRVFSMPSGHVAGYSYGASYGAYLVLIAMIVAAAGGVLALLGSGETIPGIGTKKTTAVDGNEPAL